MWLYEFRGGTQKHQSVYIISVGELRLNSAELAYVEIDTSLRQISFGTNINNFVSVWIGYNSGPNDNLRGQFIFPFIIDSDGKCVYLPRDNNAVATEITLPNSYTCYAITEL